jgi:hypothetical protein
MIDARSPWRWITSALCGLFLTTISYAQDPRKPVAAEGEELTRGPIHEAFGQPTAFDPEPGPIVPKAPPAAIEEIPPDQKPEGDNVAWMGGYWAYDDEAKDYIWVSGFWRTLPPDRKWVSGYWSEIEGGHQWVSGFWASEKTTELEYLPPPPESLENGPTTEAVEGQIWMPGCWLWQSNRYAWRPGYWAVANADWLWVPCHYEWSPNGYVFVDGYYDYPLYRRGLLFAPVSFGNVRAGFAYTPSVVLDTRFLTLSLFARPRYQHYYFGDYYDATYVQGGIYPWFSFHYSRHGYDPIYAHTSYVLGRNDPRWDANLRASYIDRRGTVAARPPRTYRAYNEWARKSASTGGQPLAIARPLTEVSTEKEFPVRVQKVTEKQTEVIKTQTKQVREFREERVKIEKEGSRDLPASLTDPKVKARKEASKVKLPEVPKLGTNPAGKTTSLKPPPDGPKFPDVNREAAPPAVRGKGRTLPDPDDIIKRPAPKATPPAVKKDPPPKVTPPPKKTPPPKGKGKDKG